MTLNLLSQFINSNNYDIRVSRNGRWIDQKCAPDEIAFVAECVIKYLDENNTTEFLSPAVWRSQFSREYVQGYFAKPDPHNATAIDEYNKFFRQPLKMFSAARILSESIPSGNTIVFKVENRPALEFIAQNDWQAYEFLYLYIKKTLQDSGLWDPFESFFDAQNSHYYDIAKEAFAQFCYKYTPINNQRETARIFAKVINPLACKLKKLGTAKGHISRTKIRFSDLKYNRENFRDVGKDKNVTRQEAAATTSTPELPQWVTHKSSKAKSDVNQYNRAYNGGFTEVPSLHSHGLATQMHHMFMQAQFPGISDFRENIVALTPTQHMTLAHPGNNTSKIDPGFQRVCLLAKMNNVKLNVLNHVGQSGFYDFNRLMEVLDVGFGVNSFQDVPENDFTTVQHMIDAQY